jgi:hypothetical protein
MLPEKRFYRKGALVFGQQEWFVIGIRGERYQLPEFIDACRVRPAHDTVSQAAFFQKPYLFHEQSSLYAHAFVKAEIDETAAPLPQLLMLTRFQ